MNSIFYETNGNMSLDTRDTSGRSRNVATYGIVIQLEHITDPTVNGFVTTRAGDE